MKTSRKQILQSSVEKSMSSPEVFPASLFLAPDSERERKMTATSGRKCLERSGKSGPLGSLAKTLLESSRWYSPVRRLKWVVQPLFSERITQTRKYTGSMSSKLSVQTSNVRDIPSGRLLFRLVPSEHRTAGTGFGLLPTVQTQGLKICGKNGKTGFMSLKLLPTPRANKVNGVNLNNPQMAQRSKGNLEESVAKIIQNTPCGNGIISQLNPLFVQEMMGFPYLWTELPFQNGGRNQSKPTGTP